MNVSLHPLNVPTKVVSAASTAKKIITLKGKHKAPSQEVLETIIVKFLSRGVGNNHS